MANEILNTKDRDFFELVSQAAFTNPFSDQRIEIDRQITQSRPGTSWNEIRPEVITETAKWIARLDEQSHAVIDDFTQSDRRIIEHVFLFDVYHRYNLDFDDLIVRQAAAGEKVLSVTFAQNALSDLKRRGFTDHAARHYFSLFYQIRRAFYYIEKGLVGQSDSMKTLRMNLWNNIFTCDILQYEKILWNRMEDFSTLLLGPTGCGKGAAAAAIGRSGFIPFDEKTSTFAESFTGMFVPINLSQYPESLLESELFGHCKGAFTGAVAEHKGLFALCGSHGSVFLDEIGEVSPQVQIKLLKVLQEREFSPVGSHRKMNFHGRVIGATNRSLDKLRTEGKFRDDFYYRLCSDCIHVPGLQQRINENPSELTDLIAVTVKRVTGLESSELTEKVETVIEKNLGSAYHWPGNVRELEQCVRSVIIKGDYEGDNRSGTSISTADSYLNDIAALKLDAKELISGYCKMLYESRGTYEQVAKITNLDRRTVKKHINQPVL